MLNRAINSNLTVKKFLNLETANQILSELNLSLEDLMDGPTRIIYKGISYRIAANNKYLYTEKYFICKKI